MHFIKGPLQSAAKWPLSVKLSEKSSISYSNAEQLSDLPTAWVSRITRRPQGLRELLLLPQSLVKTSPFFRLSTNLLLTSLLTVHPDLPLHSCSAEVEFVHAVSAGGSVKFVASGVNFSIFSLFLCFFLQILLKLGEIDGVKFLI